MVVMGRHRGGGKALAEYLMSTASNDNVEVLDIRGTANSKDLRLSLIEMSLTGEITRSKKSLYHIQINPAYGEDKSMTAEDWLKAAAILEKETGFENQPRAIVLHEKFGRIHGHVVYPRYSPALGKMIPDNYSRLAQDRARKQMEIEFGHKRTPHRNFRRPEIKKELTAVWQQCSTATEFIRLASQKGYQIVSSQSRRPFMVVDSAGRSFDLVRQLQGVRTRQVREKFQGVKLDRDKAVIRRIRDKISERNVGDTQEHALDKILKQKAKYDAQQEQLLLFKEKFNLIQANTKTITPDRTENPLEKTQTKLHKLRANCRMKDFRENEDKVLTKKETALEKALRELKESMQKADERQRQFAPTLGI